ncbi:MAG: hypothetical protein J5793_04185, partial [Clostridia bacterium]|nr:hypothetical protein [Clostridia bacterium]
KADAEKESKGIVDAARAEAAELVETTRKRVDEVNRAANEFHKQREDIQRSIDDAERRFDNVLGKLRLEILNKGE